MGCSSVIYGLLAFFISAGAIYALYFKLLLNDGLKISNEGLIVFFIASISGGFISSLFPRGRKRLEIVIAATFLGFILGAVINVIFSIPVIGLWETIKIKSVIEVSTLIVVYVGVILGVKLQKF